MTFPKPGKMEIVSRLDDGTEVRTAVSEEAPATAPADDPDRWRHIDDEAPPERQRLLVWLWRERKTVIASKRFGDAFWYGDVSGCFDEVDFWPSDAVSWWRPIPEPT